MTANRLTITLVALCAFTGAAVGGVASMPVAGPGTPAVVDDSTMPDTSAVSTDSNATGGSDRVSDCDLVDVDGDGNTVSTDLTGNATDGGANVSVALTCGADGATVTDHDLVDVDGDDNRVRVVVGIDDGTVSLGEGTDTTDRGSSIALDCGDSEVADCDAVDIDGVNNSVTLVVRGDDGRTIHEFGAGGDERGANDEDDDGDGAVDEDDEGNAGPSNDDDDGDGAIDEDDESDDGDDGADDFGGNAEDDDDGDGAIDEDDEADSGNSDDVDNDGDGAVDEDDEAALPETGTNAD